MSQKANNLIERLKAELFIKKDKELCMLLGIKHNTLSTWKKRDTLDFNKILELCEKHDLNLNYIFFEEEENATKDKQILPKDGTVYKKVNDVPLKKELKHFFSTQLVNTNRNISIFYNQVSEGDNNVSGEIIVGQIVSLKKIVENVLYIIEDKHNKFYTDTLTFIEGNNLKTSMVHLKETNKNINLNAIINIWQTLYTSTNIFKFIDGLTPL